MKKSMAAVMIARIVAIPMYERYLVMAGVYGSRLMTVTGYGMESTLVVMESLYLIWVFVRVCQRSM